MSDKTPSVSIDPNDFDPVEFGRVLVTRMLTDTDDSMVELGDIAFYERKGDLAFHLAALAAQMVEQLAIRDGLPPLEWWQRVLREDIEARS